MSTALGRSFYETDLRWARIDIEWRAFLRMHIDIERQAFLRVHTDIEKRAFLRVHIVIERRAFLNFLPYKGKPESETLLARGMAVVALWETEAMP